MFDEKVIDIVRRIFFDHDCIMTTAELNSYKLYYADIQKLLDEGLIEKVKWGYYHWVDSFDGQEVKIINRLFPDAVLCMETALFYYHYSDRNPAEWNIMVDKNLASLLPDASVSLDVSIVSTFANSKSNSSFKEDNVLESIISFAKYLPFVINLSVLTRLLLL